MTKRDETAVAWEAPCLTDADLVVGLLRAYGIPAFVDNEDATVMLDGYVGAQRIVKVRVPAVALADARGLIDEARGSAAADAGGADEEE